MINKNNMTTTNNAEKEHHATWLELFFDLVFVVIISQLSHFLLHEVSLLRFLEFLFLYIPV
jgi:low temperature requirement protein LtrA